MSANPNLPPFMYGLKPDVTQKVTDTGVDVSQFYLDPVIVTGHESRLEVLKSKVGDGPCTWRIILNAVDVVMQEISPNPNLEMLENRAVDLGSTALSASQPALRLVS